MAGTLQLGCTTGYTALIQSKEGVGLGAVPISSVTWGRKLDDVSEAVIVVPLAGPNCAPCDLIAQIGVWHHELVLFRDEEYVWSGPIVRLNVGRTQATITARDLFALMDKRLLHETHCFSYACDGSAPELLENIGKTLIDDAFVTDGHNYEVEIFNSTGVYGERLYQPGEHAFDVFTEELNLGLDATVLGRRIILGAVPFGSTATLTSDDFLVDLEIEVDGLAAATRVITLGEGVVGFATAPGTDINGESPYYGLLEFEGNNRGELNTQALANAGAIAVLAALYPPPMSIVTPTGARLDPNAPVPMSELVPGVQIPVIATDLCFSASGNYILIELSVQWDDTSNEEQVSITMGTIQSANSGESSFN